MNTGNEAAPCLHGSEEFERRKGMMRLLGMEYQRDGYNNRIMYEGEVYSYSLYTEDNAWEHAWNRYLRENRST